MHIQSRLNQMFGTMYALYMHTRVYMCMSLCPGGLEELKGWGTPGEGSRDLEAGRGVGAGRSGGEGRGGVY